MKHEKSVVLIIVQFILIAGLIIAERIGQPHAILRGGLFAALSAATALLLFARLRFKSRLERVASELKRAIRGNGSTRLLANDEPAFNEVIFSINALIEQLEAVQVRTIKSEAARKSLLSNISHDIRTPLTSIIGYVDALKDGLAVTEEEKRQYIDIISRKAAALKEMINEIFDLAKLDADELPLKREPLDLAELAREAAIGLLPELKTYGMELQANVPDRKCPIEADRLGMQRVIGNLLKNAVTYGKDGYVVGLELNEEDERYMLSVWDKGAGIREEDLPRVFDRMYRGDASRSPMQGGGSGIGLAVAKAIVEKHGGLIWAESRPGLQTVFSFTVPKEAKSVQLRNN